MEEIVSKKYKRRLVIILILIFIAAFLSTLFGKILFQKVITPTRDSIDEYYQTLEATPDEEFQRVIDENHKDLPEDSELRDKQKLLESFKTIQEATDELGESGVIIAFYLFFSSVFIGTMIIVIMIRKILYKIWKEMKLWLSVVIPTVIILLLLIVNPVAYGFFMYFLGIICQIPLIIYTIVKYIKSKKKEDKDDIIVNKEETKEE